MECPNCHMLIDNNCKKCPECNYTLYVKKDKNNVKKIDWVKKTITETKNEDLAISIVNLVLTTLLNTWNVYRLVTDKNKIVTGVIFAVLFSVLFVLSLCNIICKKNYAIKEYENHIIVGCYKRSELIIIIDNKELAKAERNRNTKELITSIPKTDKMVKLFIEERKVTLQINNKEEKENEMSKM